MSLEVIKKWRHRAEVAQAEARVWKSSLEILHSSARHYLNALMVGGDTEEAALAALYQAMQAVVPTLGDRRAAIAYQEAVILRILIQYFDMRRSSAVWTRDHFEIGRAHV